MLNDVTTFQSAACDIDTYTYITTGSYPDEWNVTQDETVLRNISVRIGNESDKAFMFVTNLPCTNSSRGIPVFKLNKLTMEEEIDPTGLSYPKPTLTFDFIYDNLNNEPNDVVSDIISKIKTQTIDVTELFVKCDLRDLRDVDGDFKHDFRDSNYFKPVNKETLGSKNKYRASIFGSYIVDNIEFDLESSTLTITATHALFVLMDKILTYNRDTCMLPQELWSESGIFGTEHVYLMAFNPILNTINTIDSRCDYKYKITPQTQISLVDNLDFNQFTSLLAGDDLLVWNQDYYYNSYVSDSNKPVKFYEYSHMSDSEFRIVPLYSYLSNVSYIESFREFALANNLMLLPSNYNFKNNDATNDPAARQIGKGYNWRLVGGVYPSEYPFPSENQNVISNKNLGRYYVERRNNPTDPTDSHMNYVYKITNHCILQEPATRDSLDLPEIKYVKTIDIPIGETKTTKVISPTVTALSVSPSTEYDNFKLTTQPSNNDDDLLNSTSNSLLPVKSKYYNKRYLPIYELPYEDFTILPEGVWYTQTSDFAMLYDNSDKELLRSIDVVGGLNETQNNNTRSYTAGLISGRRVVNPKGLYNPKLTLRQLNSKITNINEFKPFSVDIRKVTPNEIIKDINGETKTNKEDDEHLLDLQFISTSRHKGTPPVILNRVNANNLKPKYKLNWTMLDDPFLRVGTLVYYPIRGFYVKVLITKQTRIFDNGSKLQCEGWVLDETNIPIIDNTSKSTVYSGEVVAQTAIVPLMDNHWMRG